MLPFFIFFCGFNTIPQIFRQKICIQFSLFNDSSFQSILGLTSSTCYFTLSYRLVLAIQVVTSLWYILPTSVFLWLYFVQYSACYIVPHLYNTDNELSSTFRNVNVSDPCVTCNFLNVCYMRFFETNPNLNNFIKPKKSLII